MENNLNFADLATTGIEPWYPVQKVSASSLTLLAALREVTDWVWQFLHLKPD